MQSTERRGGLRAGVMQWPGAGPSRSSLCIQLELGSVCSHRRPRPQNKDSAADTAVWPHRQGLTPSFLSINITKVGPRPLSSAHPGSSSSLTWDQWSGRQSGLEVQGLASQDPGHQAAFSFLFRTKPLCGLLLKRRDRHVHSLNRQIAPTAQPSGGQVGRAGHQDNYFLSGHWSPAANVNL